MNEAAADTAEATLVLIGASYVADWKPFDLPPYKVINKGIGGQTTSDVLRRFSVDVLALEPDVVLIWGHINNVHRGDRTAMNAVRKQAIDDYRSMVEQARTNGIRVVLATEVTLSESTGWLDHIAALIGRLRGKQGYAAWVNEHVRAVNAWMREYAAAEGIVLLDFERLVDDGRGFRKGEYTTADGTHISPECYRLLTLMTQETFRER
jgi:lysophospholipase L1-like esterase